MEAEFPGRILRADHHFNDTLANDWVAGRRTFYGVFGQPTVIFDGGGRVDGASSCAAATTSYHDAIDNRLTATSALSPVSIAGQVLIGGASLGGTATFTLVDPVALGSPRAHILVVEDNVVVQSTTYHHVTRAGYEMDVLLGQQWDEAAVPFSIDLDPSWVPENLRVIAFLQDTGGLREVYQAATLPNSSAAPEPSAATSLAAIRSVAPSPFHLHGGGQATFHLHFSETAAQTPATLEVVDIEGRRVRRILSGRQPEGPQTASWNGRDDHGRTVEAGVYFLRLATADGVDGSSLRVLE